jgi:hypothetical protein
MIVIAVVIWCVFHLFNWNSNYSPFMLYVILPVVIFLQIVFEVTIHLMVDRRKIVHRIGDTEGNSGSGDEEAR